MYNTERIITPGSVEDRLAKTMDEFLEDAEKNLDAFPRWKAELNLLADYQDYLDTHSVSEAYELLNKLMSHIVQASNKAIEQKEQEVLKVSGLKFHD